MVRKLEENNIIITFILTIYEPKIYELDNQLETFKFIKKISYFKSYDIQFLIINDNPNLGKRVENYLIKESKKGIFEYFPCKENGARVKAIFDHKKYIKGKFVKAVDPDDLLIPELTINFIDKVLLYSKDNSLIIYSYNTVNEIIKFSTYKSLENKIYFKNRSFNPNTVYPAKILKRIEWNFKLLIWSDDLLGFLMVMNGAKVIEKPKYNFYLNNQHAGVSVTKTFHNNPRFTYDSINFLKIAKSKIKKNKDFKKFKKISGKPNLWFFERFCDDLLLNKSFDPKEKIYWLLTLYDLVFELDQNIPNLENVKDKFISQFNNEK